MVDFHLFFKHAAFEYFCFIGIQEKYFDFDAKIWCIAYLHNDAQIYPKDFTKHTLILKKIQK